MASPRTYTRSARPTGFTLIETLIVIGTIALIAGFSMFIDISNYQGDAFRAEESLLVTMLQTARADALNNVDEQPHGIAIQPDQYPGGYVLFEGAGFNPDSPLNQVMAGSYAVTISSDSPRIIVFDQLNGNVDYPGNITLTDPERGVSATVSVNKEGAISW